VFPHQVNECFLVALAHIESFDHLLSLGLKIPQSCPLFVEGKYCFPAALLISLEQWEHQKKYKIGQVAFREY
jgi:hypothetical protein